MPSLAVQIVRFVGKEPQPGIVACEFVDAEGSHHTFIDKVYIFSSEQLWEDDSYPQPGTVRCQILARWQDDRGRELVRINTNEPDGVESTQGLSEFVVFSTQLVAKYRRA